MIKEHEAPVFLFNRRGDWLAFRLGRYVFNRYSQWLGWLAFNNHDVYTPDGKYLATIALENRLLLRLDFIHDAVPIDTPTIPHAPGLLFSPGLAETVILPSYLQDIDPKVIGLSQATSAT